MLTHLTQTALAVWNDISYGAGFAPARPYTLCPGHHLSGLPGTFEFGMKPRFQLLLLCLFLLATGSLQAQGTVALKTNLLYGGYTATPNLGIEVGLSQHFTLEVSGGYNPWNLNNTHGSRKLVHYLVQPEVRYFFWNRFNGHYLGAHALFGQYNINRHKLPLLLGKESDNYRYQGIAYGAGLSYGYQFLLGRRWNLELGIGAGVMHFEHDVYDCVNCGEKRLHERLIYFGVTKAAVSLIYILK